MKKEPVCDWLTSTHLAFSEREAEIMPLKISEVSAALMCFLVSCTAVALLSVFLCTRHALAGFHFFMMPHLGFSKPWINWDGPWGTWRLRNLRLHTSSGHKSSVSSGSYFKGWAYCYTGECRLSWYSTAFTKGSDATGGVSIWNNSHQNAFAKEDH